MANNVSGDMAYVYWKQAHFASKSVGGRGPFQEYLNSKLTSVVQFASSKMEYVKRISIGDSGESVDALEQFDRVLNEIMTGPSVTEAMMKACNGTRVSGAMNSGMHLSSIKNGTTASFQQISLAHSSNPLVFEEVLNKFATKQAEAYEYVNNLQEVQSILQARYDTKGRITKIITKTVMNKALIGDNGIMNFDTKGKITNRINGSILDIVSKEVDAKIASLKTKPFGTVLKLEELNQSYVKFVAITAAINSALKSRGKNKATPALSPNEAMGLAEMIKQVGGQQTYLGNSTHAENLNTLACASATAKAIKESLDMVVSKKVTGAEATVNQNLIKSLNAQILDGKSLSGIRNSQKFEIKFSNNGYTSKVGFNQGTAKGKKTNDGSGLKTYSYNLKESASIKEILMFAGMGDDKELQYAMANAVNQANNVDADGRSKTTIAANYNATKEFLAVAGAVQALSGTAVAGDRALFYIANGAIYDISTIVKNSIKNKSNFHSVVYSDFAPWVPPKARDHTSAYVRSHNSITKFWESKISLYMNLRK